MIVEVQVTISGSKAQVWKVMTDFENAASSIGAIDKVEVLERPAEGLVGFKWRETRVMFGKAATEEMWVTDVKEGEYYKTRAESHGAVYLGTVRVTEQGGTCTLSLSHEAQPQGLLAKVISTPMLFLCKGIMKKAFLKDLGDIKAAVESN